jgi:hypothetical protein
MADAEHGAAEEEPADPEQTEILASFNTTRDQRNATLVLEDTSASPKSLVSGRQRREVSRIVTPLFLLNLD